MKNDTANAALLGAFVADAAALGLHWLYDPERIASVSAQAGGSAFVPINAAYYDNVPGYFAHGKRRDGMLSQYGECLRLAVDVVNEDDGIFDHAAYQRRFVGHFDMGGTYVGYIDRPTRAAVTNILGKLEPSGSDDDQLPALTRLPAVVVAMHAKQALSEVVDGAIMITNVNEQATIYGRVFADLLSRLLEGQDRLDALNACANAAPDDAGQLLHKALTTRETDSVAYGAITERACHLYQGMPLAFHILANASTFDDAVIRNINAGGDSCGRSIVIGSAMGAACGMTSIPEAWLNKLADRQMLMDSCSKLAAAASPDK